MADFGNNADPKVIHALFDKMKADVLKPPPVAPNRSQFNAFARLLREETNISDEQLTEPAILCAWYYIQDDLHKAIPLNGLDIEVEEEEHQFIGLLAAVQLDQSLQRELEAGMGPWLD